MSHMQEHTAPGKGRFGTPLSLMKIRLPRLIATGLLLGCVSMANAALIEISRTPSDRGYANDLGRQLLFWQDHPHHNRLNAYGVLPAAASTLGRPAFGAAHMRDTRAHVLHAANGSPMPNSDLYAAIDAPYGAIDSSMPSSDTDPELWTILLVATGLIGYQIRRKSRVGAIRVRPLRF